MEQSLRSILSWWDAVGVDVPKIKHEPRIRKTEPLGQRAPTPKVQPQLSQEQTKPAPQMSIDLAKSAKSLTELEIVLKGFDAGEISDHARQVVFSRGNPEADIMVIGEAPGRDEDLAGKPFVGRSGQLLDKMFSTIGLSEHSLYITNVINWSPPNNRNPKLDEITMCLPFLRRHMELMNPKIIVLVGGISFSALTGQTGIMKNRGQWTSLSVNGTDVPTLPIYHPAFLLRQPALKRDAWHDMLSLRAKLN